MKRTQLKIVIPLILLAMAAVVVMAVFNDGQQQADEASKKRRSSGAPVEVARIEHGPIELRRTYSGTLEARSEFVVSPKVSGRIEKLHVKLADTVARGQVVAELDNDEYVQAVAQAEADVAVARANLAEAKSALKIADRELQRMVTLRGGGVASESQYDAAQADQLAKQAALAVARAQVTRAESALETANIRLGYTKVAADWTNGDRDRVVAQRYADEGSTVSANASLLLIVALDPITGVIFVTEKDYALMSPGQAVR